MYFFKIKYREQRVYKTLRTRSTLNLIFQFLFALPFSSWKDIDKIKIERISDEKTR